MFEESLVESTALLQTRNRWPALLSVAAQAILAVVIIAVPMLHPELLPMHAPSLSLIPPPPPRIPPTPPPPQHVRAMLTAADAPSAPSAPLAHPSIIHTLMPTTNPTEDTAISTMGSPRMGDASTSGLSTISGSGTAPNVTVAPAAAPAHPATVHLTSGVTAGLLINPIRPEYPTIAKAARQEGTVIVRAIISRTGQIERAQVVSGPAMLQNAALEAVEHARYHPYLLNGQPTEVDTTVTITFHLGS